MIGQLRRPPSALPTVPCLCVALSAGLALFAPEASADGYSLHGEAGYQHLTNARRSAEAVLDTPGGFTFGLGARYFIGDRWFVGLDGRWFEADGERVFVAGPDSPAFGLGHPLTVRIIPVHAAFGYRLGNPQRRQVTPYVGLGAGLTSYRERSVVAEIEETDSATKASGLVLLGAELGRGQWRYGLEATWSFVPDAIGVGGVSQVYGEKDIGGLAFVARIVWSRERPSSRPAQPQPRRRS